MIRQLRKNRKSRGAAVLIAILVFFLAALSGTIALTMAESNAGRYTHEKEDQQAYLAVASASKLILDQLGSITVRFTATSTDVPTSPGDLGDAEFFKKKADGTEEKVTDVKLFYKDKNFIDQLKEIPPYRTGAEGTAEISEPEGYQTVTFKLTVDGNEKSAVLVELDAHEKTQLYINLWYAENGNPSYHMKVTVALGNSEKEEEGKGSDIQWSSREENGKTTYYVDIAWKTNEATYIFESELYDEEAEEGEGGGSTEEGGGSTEEGGESV